MQCYFYPYHPNSHSTARPGWPTEYDLDLPEPYRSWFHGFWRPIHSLKSRILSFRIGSGCLHRLHTLLLTSSQLTEKNTRSKYIQISARVRTDLIVHTISTPHASVDYVTGDQDVAVSFYRTELDGHHIASMGLQENQSFTETNNRANDGAAFYSMPTVSCPKTRCVLDA